MVELSFRKLLLSLSFILLIFTFFVLLKTEIVKALPINDDFESATVLSGPLPISIVGTNVDATLQVNEPNNIGGEHSIWYSWTSTINGTVVANTCDTTIDTMMTVYTGGTLITLTRVGENDDDCVGENNYGSLISLEVTIGTTYSFQVMGYDETEMGSIIFVLNKLGNISNCTDLQSMSSNLTLDYVITDNIDCSDTVNWNTGKGFIPIGANPSTPFTGSLDGAGYYISGLYINDPIEDGFRGLFGAASGSGFSNIHLANINYHGSSFVGGLIGYALNVTVTDSSVSGLIEATNNPYQVGGLIGKIGGFGGVAIESTISNSSSSLTISSDSSLGGVGGLVGIVGAGTVTIRNSHTTGSMTSALDNAYDIGGLIGSGWTSSNVVVSDSYSTMDSSISGTNSQYVGGIIGWVRGTLDISRTYSTGDILAGAYSESIGGFIGKMEVTATSSIKNSHSTGSLSLGNGSWASGGFVGSMSGLSTIEDSYSTGSVSIEIASYDIGGFVGMQTGTDSSIINCYSTGALELGINGVDGVDWGPFNVGGFAGVANNISRSHTSSNIHIYISESFAIGGFIGSFGAGGDGLIEKSYSTGSIVNDALVDGYNSYGGFVGNIDGAGDIISNCYTRSSIHIYDDGDVDHGDISVGGFVVSNGGLIENSYSSAAITLKDGYVHTIVGGFQAGSGTGTVTNSYWDTDLSGINTSPTGIGLTTAEMKTHGSFNTWDFGTIWKISPYLNNGYPTLNTATWTDNDCNGSCGSGVECNAFGDPPEGKMWSCRSNGSVYKCVYDDPNVGGSSCYLSCNAGWQSCGCSMSSCNATCLTEHAADPVGHYTYTDLCSGCGQKFTCGCDITASPPGENNKIITLDASLNGFLVNNEQVNIETTGSTGIKDVLIEFTNNDPIAEITADFSDNRDWTSVTAGEEPASGKAFIHSLVGQAGAGAEFTLYVPIPAGMTSNSVVVCPGVSALNQISDSCENVVIKTLADSGVTQVTIDGTMYWVITGLTGTGGISLIGAGSVIFNVSDTMTRLQVSTPSNHTIDFATVNGLSTSTDYFTIDFGTDWDFGLLSVTDMDLLDDGTNVTLGNTAGADTWGVAIDNVNGILTFTAPISGTGYITAESLIQLKIGTNSNSGGTGVNQITNPTVIDAYILKITITNTIGLEEGNTIIPIVDSDQVNITGYVNSFMSFDIDTGITSGVNCNSNTCLTHENGSAASNYTVDLGELNSTYVNLSGESRMHSDGNSGNINSIYFDLSTNANGGATVTVTSATNNGLEGPGGSNIIPITDGSVIAENSGKYGFNVADSSSVAGEGVLTNSLCNAVDLIHYCGSTMTPKEVFNTSSSPIDTARVRMDIAAAASYTNTPGLYSDTLTFVATSTF